MDENFPTYGGAFLRSKGHRVIHALQAARKAGYPDLYYIDKAIASGAIFLTLDKDFKADGSLRDKAAKGKGVAVVSIVRPEEKEIKAILLKLLNFLSKNQIANSVCKISSDKIILYE